MQPKRTPFERERDLEREARLYLEGLTQQEIAEVVGVSQQQVSDDLAEVRQRWSASAVDALAERRAFELAKIDNLERVAWEAFYASQTERADGSLSPGDPRFLDKVLRCVMARVKILGLAAPWRVDATVAARVAQAQITFTDEEFLVVGASTPEEATALIEALTARIADFNSNPPPASLSHAELLATCAETPEHAAEMIAMVTAHRATLNPRPPALTP
jgi:hypothetical protein